VEKLLKQQGSPKLLYKEGSFEKHEAAEREKQIKNMEKGEKIGVSKKRVGKPR
jgi:predicted GIY-YIG superfamily endonuclease